MRALHGHVDGATMWHGIPAKHESMSFGFEALMSQGERDEEHVWCP